MQPESEREATRGRLLRVLDEHFDALLRTAGSGDVHCEAVERDRFTTAHYVRIHHLESGGIEIRVATAGHPEIFIRRRDGSMNVVSGSGPMLGLMPVADYREGQTEVNVGDLVVLYTDGIIEARRGDTFFGTENLTSFLQSWTGPIKGCARALHDAVVSFSGEQSRDDMATVMLKREM